MKCSSTAAQREKGLTDDLALENPGLAKHQLEEAVWRATRLLPNRINLINYQIQSIQ
jgi:hypothetical protein